MSRVIRDFSKEPLYLRYRQSPMGDRSDPLPPACPLPEESLVDYLEKLFPARCRERGETELDHERYAGKVELIAFLRDRLEEGIPDNTKIIETEVTNNDVHVQSTEGGSDGASSSSRAADRSPRGPGNRRSA